MRPERAKLLFSGESGAGAASNDAEHTGIGLRNIRARLLKLFGERFDIQVESRPQEGTCVRIYFPRKG
jgi:sensor histidine kinase YesM